MSERTWTPSQRQAIETVGVSLVVSAAAGSGKTAVLAARFVELVVAHGVGVGEILVVTFTVAAAAEMRERIAANLAEAIEAASDTERGRLSLEAERLSAAPIGTIDGFCSNLVRRHYTVADVDAGFGVLDAEAAAVMRRQLARDTVDAALAEPETAEAVAQLADDVYDGEIRLLAESIVSLRETLSTLPDADDRLATTLARVEEAAAADEPFDSELGRLVLGRVRAAMPALRPIADELRAACDAVADDKRFDKLAAFARAHAANLDVVADAVETGDLASAKAAMVKPEGSLSLGPRNHEGKVRISAAVNAARDALAAGELADVLATGSFRDGVRSTLGPTRTLLNLLDAFSRRYQEEKRRARQLDFADLEHAALRLLRGDDGGPSDLAIETRGRYRHVLVDEAQDLNALQDTLLTLVSRRDNLFVVGDVKQSVYGFRHAEPHRFDDRLTRGDATRIDLQANFRSRPPLLKAINDVMSRLMTSRAAVDVDYADHHDLRPGGTIGEPPANGFRGSPVDILVLDRDGEATADDDEAADLEQTEREAVAIARQIRGWMDENRHVEIDGVATPLGYGHVAVLMRSPRFNSRRFTAAMRRHGVPCRAEVGTGFFSAIEVLDLVGVLRLLDNRRRDVELAGYLRSPLAGLPAELDGADVLARCRLAMPESHAFADAVEALAASDDPAAAAVQAALGKLDEWAGLAWDRPVAEVVWRVLSDTGYLAYVEGLRDGPQRRANLLDVHARAADFDAARRGSAVGVGEFVAYLAALDEAGEVGQATGAGGGEADDAVRLLSIHASKGLEFPIVFLADCGKAHNLRSVNAKVRVHPDVGVALPAIDVRRQVRFESMQGLLAKWTMTRAALAEELRLLYVAMTRAREHLVCVGHARKADELLAAAEAFADVERIDGRDVLRGKSFLEWLLMGAVGRPETFSVRFEPAADLDRRGNAAERTPVPEAVRLLAEIEANPASRTAAIDRALRRLATPYEHVTATRRAAAVNLTPWGGGRDRVLSVLLRHLDWADAADEAAVKRQAANLVNRELLHAGDDVDAEAVVWLASTEPVRAYAAASRRWADLPVYAAGDEGTGDDRAMLRGRASLLAETPGLNTPLTLADVAWEDDPATRERAAELARLVVRATGRATAPWVVRVGDRHARRLADAAADGR